LDFNLLIIKVVFLRPYQAAGPRPLLGNFLHIDYSRWLSARHAALFLVRSKEMVKIRLSRGGAKKRPFYHIVVADIRRARDGRYIERIGFFNPIAAGGEPRLRVDRARVDYWLGCGAQPTERVASLLREASAETAVH